MTILAPDPTRAFHRFQASMATAHTTARVQQRPCNPVQPDAVLTLDGQTYAVEWRGGGLSKTMELTCTVTRHDTGRAHELVLIRSERQSKRTGRSTVRYNLKGQPAWATRDEAQLAMVALAAPLLTGLSAYNPVTGPALLPVRLGGAA